ncbi:MAG: 6-bladed beta-propeller [Gemmatimonadota bacterium]|nr:6-bladed beta-propeller [Gemmatimonadota bacterium]
MDKLLSHPLRYAWILIGLMGCGNDAPPGVTVTDSAGVRITITPDDPRSFAELDSTPALSFGGAETDGPTQFFGIQGIHVDDRERIWVADAQSGELRIFDADGSHWKTRGGRGEGPGEFVRIRLLGSPRGDSVLVGDSGTNRITIFDAEGEIVRTEPVPATERAVPRLFDVFVDGSALGRVPLTVAATSLEPGSVLRDSVELVRLRRDSARFDAWGTAPGPLWLWTGANQIPIPFTVNASFDILGADVHLVSGPDFRIRVLERGDLREIYGMDRQRRAIDDSDIAAYHDFVEEWIPAAERAGYLAAVTHEQRPEHLPGYDRVVVSQEGYVWAQVYESDLTAAHDWHVFDDERHFVGHVTVWGGFQPMVITQDAMVGVWRDELGIEHVRVYEFTRR